MPSSDEGQVVSEQAVVGGADLPGRSPALWAGSVTHLQLAESVWNPHKKRSEVRIVHNCGRAEDPKTAERLRHLARSILKKCDPEEVVQHSSQWGSVRMISRN